MTMDSQFPNVVSNNLQTTRNVRRNITIRDCEVVYSPYTTNVLLS